MNYNNLAQRTNFIASSDKFKNLPFFLTSLNIPGINLSHPDVGGKSSTRIKLSGDTLTFNALSFEMLIDEDFLIYQELKDIINKNIDIATGTFKDFYFDFFIELTNSKGNKVLKLDFINCRIESIGDIMLDTQDEEAQYTLSMEMVYDYYETEQIRLYEFLPGIDPILVNPPPETYAQKTYNENFSEISNDWQLWGFPTPVISNDDEATNGLGLDSNGSGTYEAGAVLNGLPIDVTRNFDFTFRVKQPLGADSNESYYLEFGVTEGIGVQSTSNGRTGNTVMGVLIDGGNYNAGSSTKAITYKVKNSSDIVSADYSNDGQYHEYKFTYTIDGVRAEYQIYKDNVLQKSITGDISNHDNLYLYVQGKSDAGPQFIDTISGNYGEEV